MNEQVTITVAANTQQMRDLFAQMDAGFKKTETSAKKAGESWIKSFVDADAVANRLLQTLLKVIQAETQYRNQRAGAAISRDEALRRVQAEGGLTSAQAAGIGGAIDANVQRLGLPSFAYGASAAQQLLEGGMSAADVQGGGLDSALSTITAVNARGEVADPKALVTQMVKLLRISGRKVTTGNLDAAGVEMQGLLNWGGTDIPGMVGLLESMSQAGGSRQGRAVLEQLKLKPGDVDIKQVGTQAALKNLMAARGNMSENAFLGLVGRLGGGGGADIIRQGMQSGPLEISRANYQRDLEIATGGVAADSRRSIAAEQAASAARGESAARFDASRRANREGLRKDNWPEAAIWAVETVEDAILGLGLMSEEGATQRNNRMATKAGIDINIKDTRGRATPGTMQRGATPLND